MQQKRALVAAEVDAQKGSEAELERALVALDTTLRSQQAAATAAERAAERAAAEEAALRDVEDRTRAEVVELRRRVKAMAVNAYMRGPAALAHGIETPDFAADAVRGRVLLEAAVRTQAAVVAARRAKSEALAVLRERAEVARKSAAARRRDAEKQLGEVRAARARQQQVVDAAEARLERNLGEAAALASLDAQLAAEIVRRQEALARQVAAARSRPAAGTAPTARPTPPAASAGQATARAESPARPTPLAAPPARPPAPALTTVRGITVASSIADELASLLRAAEAGGLSLGGGGYRSANGQIATRRANCGTSDYDVYEKPASECVPPTARPGQSMHEHGLAVDFTNAGRLITSPDDPAFQWLRANANRFGFYNLPSEPWHWSTNGN